MLAWLKKFRRPVAPREPSDLDIANDSFADVAAKFNRALEEYRVGTVKLQCQTADRDQLERIRACRRGKLDDDYTKELKP